MEPFVKMVNDLMLKAPSQMFDQVLTGFDFSFNSHLVKYFFLLFYKFYFFQYSKTNFKFCCTRLDFYFYSSVYLRKNIQKYANFSLSPIWLLIWCKIHVFVFRGISILRGILISRDIFIFRDFLYLQKKVLRAKTAVCRCSAKQVFLKNSQYPQGNTCVVVSLFLIKLQWFPT